MLEVIHCLPEQGDITKVAVLVLKEYTTQKGNKPSVRINQHRTVTQYCMLYFIATRQDINVDNYTGFSSQVKHLIKNVLTALNYSLPYTMAAYSSH